MGHGSQESPWPGERDLVTLGVRKSRESCDESRLNGLQTSLAPVRLLKPGLAALQCSGTLYYLDELAH